MISLNFFEDLNWLLGGIYLSRGLRKNLLFAPKLAQSNLQNAFRRQGNEFAVPQHFLKFVAAQGVMGMSFRRFFLLQISRIGLQLCNGLVIYPVKFSAQRAILEI